MAKITPELATLCTDPVYFSEVILGLKLYDWQKVVMRDVIEGHDTYLRAANGSGKTSHVAAPLLLWHSFMFAKSQVIDTAGVYRQVRDQLWPQVKNLAGKLGPQWTVNATELKSPHGSIALGFSTDDAYKFEGFHGGESGCLLVILDEAKSIPDEIYDAVERCRRGTRQFMKLVMSSPGGSTGKFYEAFRKPSKFSRLHVATAYDCSHMPKKEIADYIERNGGVENPLVKSSIFAEFTESYGEGYVIPGRFVELLFQSPPAHRPGEKYAAIDWAAGGDENVIAIRDGNRVEPLICWKDKDTMKAAGRAVSELRKHGIAPGNVWADDGGLGKPINDACRDLGFPMNRVLNNHAANRPDHYKNIVAEKWMKVRQMIEKQEVILPKDDILIKQLSNRKQAEVKSDGKFGLESKEDMRSRGVGSPDRADAVILVLTVGNNYLTNPKSVLYYPIHEYSEDVEVNQGFHAG
jgi:hypothetical protein